ncbi:Ribosomal protein mitochondrial [Fasciola gigantica]|uniref:Ribosomal protein mitochondrial n=1 Tax=Fasciola gigantica TaxID=46835 RepID=A0A504YQC2_FASGI|nr:Ribosomal protein mitochondrial [Fasciola gigantica]
MASSPPFVCPFQSILLVPEPKYTCAVLLLARRMSSAPGFVKTVMVLLESTAGSGHRIVAFRPKVSTGRKEKIAFDPFVQQNVLYRELRKIRSLRKATP